MPKDKTASHVKVMAAAREEFLEYGFEKASMRRVGDRCDFTAAGLYRHCRDKADLFDQLVSPAVERIHAWMNTHLSRYLTAVRDEGNLQWQDSFLHDLTQTAQEQTLQYLPILREKGLAVRAISPMELHLLYSAYVTALFEPVIHRYTLNESMRCLETVEAFFLPGWKALFGF